MTLLYSNSRKLAQSRRQEGSPHPGFHTQHRLYETLGLTDIVDMIIYLNKCCLASFDHEKMHMTYFPKECTNSII